MSGKGKASSGWVMYYLLSVVLSVLSFYLIYGSIAAVINRDPMVFLSVGPLMITGLMVFYGLAHLVVGIIEIVYRRFAQVGRYFYLMAFVAPLVLVMGWLDAIDNDYFFREPSWGYALVGAGMVLIPGVIMTWLNRKNL